MTCPACGAAISAFDTWCPSCGATVGAVKATVPASVVAAETAAEVSAEVPVAQAAMPAVAPETSPVAPVSAVPEPKVVIPSESPRIEWPGDQAAEPAPPPVVAPAPMTSTSAGGGGKRAAMAAAAVVAVIAIGSLFFFTQERAILTRVSAGNLVTPAGDSAYDKWRTWMEGRPSPSDQAHVAAAAAPRLRARGEAILNDLKSNNRESEAGWAEAASIFEWLSALEPTADHRAALHFSVGRLHFSKGEHAAALRDYYAAVEAGPNWALALNGLARTLARMGDRSAAQQFYIKATQAEPAWIFPWLNLAAASLEIKDAVIAEQAALKALALDSGRASAHFFLARAYDDTRRYCEAVAAYKSAIDLAYRSDDPGFSIDSARRRAERLTARYACP